MALASADEIAADADDRLAGLLARTDAVSEATLGDAYHGRRVADVLAHLHAWHIVFEGWIAQDRAGAVPAFPAEGYTWRDLDALNDALFEAHRERSYEAVRAGLVTSHNAMLDLLRTFSPAQLGERGHYAWLGDQTLAGVAHECLGAHYGWAQDLLDSAGVAPMPGSAR